MIEPGLLPPAYAATRLSLHRLAAYVRAPALHRSTGAHHLLPTDRGVTTPPFGGDGTTVAVEGGELVLTGGGEQRRAPITTLADAARFVGVPPATELAVGAGSPEPGPLDQALEVDEASARHLLGWWRFGGRVIREVAVEPATPDPAPLVVRPERFELVTEWGDERRGRRASVAASPGDAGGGVEEPHLAVRLWDRERVPASEAWDATTFPGAVLPRNRLLVLDHPEEEALAFLRRARDVLAA